MVILRIVYVNNGAFTFEYHDSFIKGITLVYNQFVKFCLGMHVGCGEKLSKTKCTVFPLLGFFTKKSLLPSTEIDPNSNPLVIRMKKDS